jgi:stage 0 sporulation regulatory protein
MARIKSGYLKVKIHILRSRMIHKGKAKGLTHPDTVKCSQKLDGVLNQMTLIK